MPMKRAPRGKCLVCLRDDAATLLERRKAGESARHIALEIHESPRIVAHHFQHHCHGALRKQAAAKTARETLASLQNETNAEARLTGILHRIESLADMAEQWVADAPRNKDAHSTAKGYLQEIRATAESIARARGELQASGTVTVVNQLGVRIDEAQRCVTLVQQAEAVEPRDRALRAARVLAQWNASHPLDPIGLGDGPQAGEVEESRSTSGDWVRESVAEVV